MFINLNMGEPGWGEATSMLGCRPFEDLGDRQCDNRVQCPNPKLNPDPGPFREHGGHHGGGGQHDARVPEV